MPVYLNEKTKKYYCSFYYTDWQGKRLKKKKEGFTLARDAKAWEQDFLNKTAGNCEMKFSALFEYFIADYKARHRPTTATNRELALRKHALPYFADMPLSAITPVMVRNWQNSLITAGYKATYQRSLNGYLKVMFNFAVKYYKLKENPVTLAGAIGAGKAGLINFWTVSEFYTFLDKLQTGEPLARRRLAEKVSLEIFLFAFNVLFYTGIRLGELLALTVSDYNPAAKSISINKSYAYINGKALILPPKTPKNRRLVTFLHSQRSTTPLASAEKVEKSPQNKKKGNLFSRKSSLGSHLVAIQKLPFLPPLRPQWFPAVFGSHLVATL